MDSYSSLVIPDFDYENEFGFSSMVTPSTFLSFQEPNPPNNLDFSSLVTPPSTFISFQEPNPPNPIIHCANTENGEPENKRAKHRNIERRRRKEITSHFKNLRHVLPLQYIKGRRSSSDHVLEAANYIKDLEKNIKDLNEKRDRFKTSITHSSSEGERSTRSLALSSSCSCVGDTHIEVKVRTCLVGMEIVASCCFRHGSFLSNVLHLLAQEQGFNVVSCISTRLHQRFIHTIVSEVEEWKEVNIS